MFEELFEKSYKLLISPDLIEKLKIWNETTNQYERENLYFITGGILTGLVLLICFIYYYTVNHPRQNRWWIWLFYYMLPVALINGVIAFVIAKYMDIENIEDISSNIPEISMSDCIGFGMINFFYSLVLFAFISLIMKWGSRNCKYSPL